MKHRYGHMSFVGLTAFCILLPLILASATDRACEDRLPTGHNNGAVCFDAIIELNSPERHTHVLLFARYWVKHDSYSISVTWAEPHAAGLRFAVYPPTLFINSDKEGFTMGHQMLPLYNATYPKPLGERGVFRYMFGDYRISNIRFAEQEALATRVYVDDLRNIRNNMASQHPTDISALLDQNDPAREVAKLKAHIEGERVYSLDVLTQEDRLLKKLSYDYHGEVLGTLTAILPEQSTEIGFRGEGITVAVKDHKYQYKDFETLRHQGGRICTVKYERVSLHARTIPLPMRVLVRDGRKGNTLRSVRLTNFCAVEPHRASIPLEASQFGALTEQERIVQDLFSRYSTENSGAIQQADTNTLRRLLLHFESSNEIHSAEIELGIRLKHINMLMNIGRLLDDDARTEQYFRQYLRILLENDCQRMLLFGGYGAINASVRWGRYAEADRLVRIWAENTTCVDTENILDFSAEQLKTKRFWTTAVLLEHVTNGRTIGPDLRLRAQVLRCKVLRDLKDFLTTADARNDAGARAYVAWLSSPFGAGNVTEALRECIRESYRTYRVITNPTEEIIALKAQLDKLDEQSTDLEHALQ